MGYRAFPMKQPISKSSEKNPPRRFAQIREIGGKDFLDASRNVAQMVLAVSRAPSLRSGC
jgi:hypothetical protein